MAKIAFIGLGHMGGGMAPNLAKAGHEVRAFDLVAQAVEKAVSAGCTAAPSAAEAVKDADVVVTMLPAAKHVRAVYRKRHRAEREGWRAPDRLFDHRRVERARSRRQACMKLGFEFVDAPVSGGIAAAAGGNLTFMVGGSDEAFAQAQPILEPMAKAVIHAGQLGAGQAAKICNNMILGATMVATCEAFVLAQKLGLDPAVFFDISSKASGQSWSMTSYAPVPGVGPETPADHDYEGGFASGADAEGSEARRGGRAKRWRLHADGCGGGEALPALRRPRRRIKDFSGIIKMIDDSWTPPKE